MNYIDLNEIGRSLFKQRYNIEDKRKLTFDELRWYIDDTLEHYKSNSTNVIHCSRETTDFIGALNNLLLLCYLNNININNHIQIKINDDNINEKIK